MEQRKIFLGAVRAGGVAERPAGHSIPGGRKGRPTGQPVTESTFLSSSQQHLPPLSPYKPLVKPVFLPIAVEGFGVQQLDAKICFKEVLGTD